MKHSEKPMSAIPARPAPHVQKVIEESIMTDAPGQGGAPEELPAAAASPAEKSSDKKSKKKKPPKLVRLSIDMEPDFHTALRHAATDARKPLAEIGRDLFEKWLAKQ